MKVRSEEDKDILRELGNIGGGNALTSLSEMLGRPLDMDVPECRIVERSEAASMLKNPDALYAGVCLTVTGTLDCVLVLLMNKEFTQMAIETLDQDAETFDVLALTDMQKSALCEVGNIMGNSYITAIGALLDTYIDVSVPHIVVDAGSCVLERFLEEHHSTARKLLFVNNSFPTDDKRLESYLLMCPSEESLTDILAKLSF